jgi:DNA replication protein DnaC
MTLYKQSFLVKPEEVLELKTSIIGKFCKNKCGGKGAVLKNSVFVNCECVEEFERRLRLIQANVPKKYWNFNLRKLTKEYSEQNKVPLEIIKKYIEKISKLTEEGVGLYIQGTYGLAKTALSHYILKESIKQDIVCYSISMSKLTNILYNTREEENIERIEWIKKDVQLLFIDEIEKEYSSDNSSTFMGSLVNDFFRSLYDTKKSLIITSNLSKKALKESKVHAHNITDRFEELVDIVLTGNSFRRQNENLKLIIED